MLAARSTWGRVSVPCVRLSLSSTLAGGSVCEGHVPTNKSIPGDRGVPPIVGGLVGGTREELET